VKYIFIDESGDLGSKNTSSKYFIFTAVLTDNQRVLEHCIKKVWNNLNKKQKRFGELHAYNEKDVVRQKILEKINNSEIKIVCCVVDKAKIPIRFRKDKKYLYNQILISTIESICEPDLLSDDSTMIYIDRMYARMDDVKKLERSILQIFIKGNLRKHFVYFQSSQENKSLQAVDFISWSLFRKIEKDDSYFINIIDKIKISIKYLDIKRKLPC
jgi:hypothetical protein